MGADISEWQGQVDFEKMAASGITHVEIRSTYGAHYVDKFFEQNVAGARAAGLVVTIYHYALFSVNTADAEASFFEQVAGPHIQPGDGVPYLDFEKTRGLALPPLQAMIEWKAEWLGRIDALIRKPAGAGFYSYRSILANMYPHLYPNRPVWGSTIGNTPPTRFELSRWSMNQYGEGAVPGVTGLCDLDRMLTPSLPELNDPRVPGATLAAA